MDEDQIADVLKAERLGHEEPGMRGVYGHVSQSMREELKAALEARWQESLHQRAQITPRSAVPLLDKLLAAVSGPPRADARSVWLPKSDVGRGGTRTADNRIPSDLRFWCRGGRI
ncbi:MAG: hypothetical protein JO037_11720 [Actinobacteria bacterium]|nr:hypothetical protein [Actinomycetota bacterium]